MARWDSLRCRRFKFLLMMNASGSVPTNRSVWQQIISSSVSPIRTRAPTITAVERPALVHDDLLGKAVRLDVGYKRVEIGALDQRENVGQRMKLDGHLVAPF